MRSFLFVLTFSLVSALAYGQSILSGRILDIQETPLPDVTVADISNNKASVSDRNGHFKISVKKLPAKVVFKKMGFKTDTITVYTLSPVLVKLTETSIDIEEVAVVNDGFQSFPKERATGAFEQLDGELLRRRISTNVLSLLDGISPGLQFDNRTGSPRLHIRGINTFSEGLVQPLIVVDNFPFEGSLDMINPNDVESVTLLKDAAASSIWGTRAGNGVIVINMKKSASDRLRVNLTSNLTMNKEQDLFYEPIVASADFIDIEEMLFEKGHYDNLFLNPAALKTTVISPVIDLLYKTKNGEIRQEDAISMIDLYQNHDYRKDLAKLYRAGALQQQHINISGGSPIGQHGLSVGWDRNVANEITNRSDRITLRQNSNYKFNNGLNVSTDITYANAMARNSLGNTDYMAYPYTRLFDENGGSLPVPYLLNQNYVDTVGNGRLMDWTFNPYEDIHNARNSSHTEHLNANIRTSYPIFSKLKVNMIYGFEKQNGNSEGLYNEDSFFARNLINQFTQLANDTDVKYNLPKGNILDRSYAQVVSHRVRGQLDFSHEWQDMHDLTVLGGMEISHRQNNGNAYRIYGYDENVLTEQKVDYVNAYPTYDNLYGQQFIPYIGGSTEETRRFISVFANGAYTFKGKYTFSASLRRDGSNVFGVKTNERWNPLWSTGLAWIASNESFLKDVGWLNQLKIRSTLGISGNAGSGANIDPIMQYNNNTARYTNYPYALITFPPNPSLKWEEVRMLNNAIDFSVFSNRLSGSVEWFEKWSTDLIASDMIDPTTGFSDADRNIGKIRGKGMDIKLEGSSRNESLIPWKITLGYSFAQSKVERYTGTLYASTLYAQNGSRLLNPIEDKLLYPVLSYHYAGLDSSNGDPQGYLDGEVSKDYQALLADSVQNMRYHGTALPRRYGFVRGVIGWKNTQLTFSINYKFGHYFQKSSISYSGLFSGTGGHGDYYKRWQQTGDEQRTNVPSMVYPGNAERDNFFLWSGANILKGDVIRLQDVRLTHQFRKFPVILHASVNNVGILWRANKENLDPDYFSTPPGRVFAVGININL